MTTNDATPRTQLAKVIDDAPFLPTSDARIGDLADLIIDHLWERAESEEVVEAVELICFNHGMSRIGTCEVVETLLTALLGPKPRGEGE